MPTPRTAFVHIGPPKTGSTAIQAACFDAKAQLSEAGFHYLSGDRNHSELLATLFWSQEDAAAMGQFRWIDDPEAFRKHRHDLMEAFLIEIASVPGHLIISSEALSELRNHEVESFVTLLQDTFDRVHVIAYARDPQSWMSSAAQQGTKWSGDLLDALFAHPRLPEYERRLTSFKTAVGAENFDLRPFGATKQSFDVVTDFESALGIEGVLHSNQPRANSAISDRTAILFSALNAVAPPFVNRRHNPCRAYGFVSDGRVPGRKFELPQETVLGAEKHLQDEYAWLDQAFGRKVFTRPAPPQTTLADWFGPDRAALEDFALTFAETCRTAQNEKALQSLLRAQNNRTSHPDVAQDLLTNAWQQSTDRWTMHLVATEAVATNHPDKQKMFAKQRLMRRLEDPAPGDAPLEFGNPFERNQLEDEPLKQSA